MASENGQHGDPQAEQATEQAMESSAAGESQFVEEPDEPVNPDETTRAETEAAHAALVSRGPRRKYKAPRSIGIMLLVVAMVVAVGIYALQWALRQRENNDKADLQRLEERQVMSTWQIKGADYQTRLARATLDPEMVVKPKGLVYEPLSPAEKAKLEELQTRFPDVKFTPDKEQQKTIDDIAASLPPETQPATKP